MFLKAGESGEQAHLLNSRQTSAQRTQSISVLKIRRHILETAYRRKGCSKPTGRLLRETSALCQEFSRLLVGTSFINFCSSSLCTGASIVRGVHWVFPGSQLNKTGSNWFIEESRWAWSGRPMGLVGFASGRGWALLHPDKPREWEISAGVLKTWVATRMPHSCESPRSSRVKKFPL